VTEQQGLVKPIVLSNGIVREDFEPHIGKGEKDPYSVVYTSCPSRGLTDLLDIWPEVKAAVPEARLDIYYDWTMVRENQPEFFEKLTDKMKSVSGLDVIHHGGVSHEVLNEKLRKANIWAYSHFQNPMVETFCISAVKASASGCACLTVPNGAVPEVAPMSRFETSIDSYKAALIEMLGNGGPSLEERVETARDALERFAWDSVAKRFSEEWTIRKPSTAGGEEGPTLRIE
jgi:glycosyltransferase involved in cell wall biosynthesis